MIDQDKKLQAILRTNYISLFLVGGMALYFLANQISADIYRFTPVSNWVQNPGLSIVEVDETHITYQHYREVDRKIRADSTVELICNGGQTQQVLSSNRGFALEPIPPFANVAIAHNLIEGEKDCELQAVYLIYPKEGALPKEYIVKTDLFDIPAQSSDQEFELDINVDVIETTS